MFKGVVMVNIYEEQLKQLINTSSQLDRFFILDKDGNFLLRRRPNRPAVPGG